ncbi:hypothetical protein DFH28DRAFT_1170996 [Melampsora americana]|nr:hypothetical protein DFH28DRAFT_1170996 [Melampsora americana]
MVRITQSGAQHPSPITQKSHQSTVSQSNTQSNKRPAPAKASTVKSKRVRAVRTEDRSTHNEDPDPINTQTAATDTDDDNIDDDDYNPVEPLDDLDDDRPFSLPPPLPPRLDHEQSQSSTGALPQMTRTSVANSDPILPTISTYQQAAKEWPQSRIANFTRGKKLSNVVPPKILDEMKAIQKLYHHHKLMLAMMGNVTLYTLNKAIGELGRKRKQDGFHLWMSYGIDALNYKMPRSAEIGALAQQNKDLGDMWKNYSVEHQQVFNPDIFYDLSGLPRPPQKSDDEADIDEDDLNGGLTPEERKEMQTLYDKMVCVERVASVYAKVAAGNPTGDSLPEFNQKSLKRVNQLHDEIHNESNRMQFAYYFLAAGTHAASSGQSAEAGWCQEYTSDEEMADYVRDKANFPTMFATHVQGLSVNEVVSRQNGKRSKDAKTITPTDRVKGELSSCLRQELILLKVSIIQDCSASWVKA